MQRRNTQGVKVHALARELSRNEESPAIDSVAFTRDGKTVAAAGDEHFVTLWDVATGQERRRLAGHRAAVRSIAMSPDGKMLASGSDDGTALLWDLSRDAQPVPAIRINSGKCVREYVPAKGAIVIGMRRLGHSPRLRGSTRRQMLPVPRQPGTFRALAVGDQPSALAASRSCGRTVPVEPDFGGSRPRHPPAPW